MSAIQGQLHDLLIKACIFMKKFGSVMWKLYTEEENKYVVSCRLQFRSYLNLCQDDYYYSQRGKRYLKRKCVNMREKERERAWEGHGVNKESQRMLSEHKNANILAECHNFVGL
jgi:hypothetical protein